MKLFRWALAGLGLALLACAQQAPPAYRVAFHTTAGDFTVEVHRDWAPRGADRFYQLVAAGYYNGDAFYRVIPGFVAQWGLSPDPATTARWRKSYFPDDPVAHSNTAGTITFAAAGKNTRTTEVFINLRDNPRLDKSGFAPFGEVVEGLATVRELDGDYGDTPPNGHGPDPGLIAKYGAAYLTRLFPRLDVIYSAKLLPRRPAGAPGGPRPTGPKRVAWRGQAGPRAQ